MYTYLLLNIGTLAFPLLLSFDRKVAFYRRWKALFPAIFLTGFVFILWDVAFTHMGIWSFNPAYLVGISIWGLPIEEWMFFFTVPYACVFIYDCLKAYLSRDLLGSYAQQIQWGLIIILGLTGLWHWDHWYTATSFLGTASFLIADVFWWKRAFKGYFFLAYLIAFIPFFLVNGILTAWPVVIYNDLENLGIRLGTIPLDDTIYNMLLLLMNIYWYEYFQEQWFPKAPQAAI